MLIRNAELAGQACDVRVAAGRIAAIGADLPDEPETLDAHGGALLPGLHDHHLHLFALARAAESVRCDVPGPIALARALARGPVHRGWLRGTHYHEEVAGPLSREVLDALAPERPVRIQHRTGAAWFLNSAAIAALRLDAGSDAPGVERDALGRATGALYGLDEWLRAQLPRDDVPDLGASSRRLARFGVTGVTDATPDNAAETLRLLSDARASGALLQDVRVMGRPDLPTPQTPGLTRGAFKILLRENALPELDAFVAQIRRAHAQGRGVAIHCVTRSELVYAAAALREADRHPEDRIEHASIAPPAATALLAGLGVAVVTQPSFVYERGDAYLRDVREQDRPWLYRCGGLQAAGIPVGGSTDAPFGDPDPWQAMRAAVDRRTRRGAPLALDEAVSPERALALFTTLPAAPGATPRRVAVGERADLCLLDRPWKQARDRLAASDVVATLRSGAILAARHPNA